jgi:hypothetical protein
METQKIKINRAPVLTLWAKVVSERLGYDTGEALSLAKAVAGLNAQSKGRRLGIYGEPKEIGEAGSKERKAVQQDMVTVLGRPVPVVKTKDGLRASIKGEQIAPESVQTYLEKKFGETLPEVEAAMQTLAKAHPPAELERGAYALYEKFRPQIPEGTKGWGAAGELDLGYIRSLAK